MSERSRAEMGPAGVGDRVPPGGEPGAVGGRDAGGPGRGGAGVGGAPQISRDDLEGAGFLHLVNVLLKRWKLMVGLPLAAAVVTAAVSLLIPPKFTATASFVPESDGKGVSLPSGVAGLAAQFGMAVPGVGGSSSPAFYADVLGSRTLKDQALLARFPDPRTAIPTDSARLIDILDVEGETESGRLEQGRRHLSEVASARVDAETNIVRVSVETRYRQLSADVANLFVELLNRFNLETRQSNAQERGEFIAARLEAAERELREAEEELRRFLERNRRFEDSPELTFQYERLRRRVTSKEEVANTLRRSYEEARIQEVNDTPVITVIDRAVPPEEKSSPRRRTAVVLAFFLGAVFATFGALGGEFLERARERDDEEFDEFTSRWAAIRAEIRSLLARVGLSRR